MDSNAVDVIIAPHEASIGSISVRRTLPTVRRRMVGPFAFLDHIGPMPTAQGRLDVLPHPHIGIATLTYIFEGALVHRDTLGNTQPIRPREVNWMVSGRGIAHSERTSPDMPFESMNAVQAWVALPEELEESEPGFTHADEHELPLITEKGVAARLLAGSAYALTSSIPSHSPLFYVAVHLANGASIAMPRDYSERAAYIVDGSLSHAGQRHEAGHLIVFKQGGEPVITASTESDVLLLGGEPVGRRFMWWNFVSSRRERIEEAKEDWKAGRIALPPDDDREFVPLPPDSWPKPKPEPMS